MNDRYFRLSRFALTFLAIVGTIQVGRGSTPLDQMVEGSNGQRGILVHLGCGDPMAAFEGRLGSELWSLSAEDGTIVSQMKLGEMPISDGMIVADSRLYLCTTVGAVVCMGGE